MHAARKCFIQAESSDRIRRALSHNVRTYADVTYCSGDIVYYRRKNFKGWKGPGTVIGQDGQLVAVRHQAEIYRVHPHQLLLKEHFVSTSNAAARDEGVSRSSSRMTTHCSFEEDTSEDEVDLADPPN